MYTCLQFPTLKTKTNKNILMSLYSQKAFTAVEEAPGLAESDPHFLVDPVSSISNAATPDSAVLSGTFQVSSQQRASGPVWPAGTRLLPPATCRL